MLIEKLVLGKYIRRLPAPVRHLYTMVIVVIGWVFFASPGPLHRPGLSPGDVLPSPPGTVGTASLVMPWLGMGILGVLASTPLAKTLWEKVQDKKWMPLAEGALCLAGAAPVHRQPGQRQLQSLPVFPVLRGEPILEKLKQCYKILPMLVFLVFLGVMAVLLFALPDKDYSPNEKRYLASAPEVTVEGILSGKTQEDLEKYTADQIPGRDFYVGVNAYWNLATGRNAAQDIYYCDDGYLINAPKAMNETVFTNNLTKFDQFAAQLGVPADLIMVPSTGYLMEEVPPTFHGAYDDDQLYDLASQQPAKPSASSTCGRI